jgi:hypothetical protein
MGLSKQEIEEMTIGGYMDLFDAYKAIYNMETKRILYTIQDRMDETVSMSDL